MLSSEDKPSNLHTQVTPASTIIKECQYINVRLLLLSIKVIFNLSGTLNKESRGWKKIRDLEET